MKFFLIVIAGERGDTELSIVAANDVDEAFGKFLDNQDLDIETDVDDINYLLENYPVGIGELPKLSTLNKNFYDNIQLDWYYSV